MKFAKQVQTLICDDVRQEVGNKMSLIGIYGQEIVIDQVPSVLPRLCLVVLLGGKRNLF